MPEESNTPGVCFDATGTLIETSATVGDVYHSVALLHGIDLPAWRLQDAFVRVMRGAPPRGLEGDTFESRCRNEIEWWSERIRQTFQATDSTARFADFQRFARALFDTYAEPDAWRARPGIPQALSKLCAAGCPMAVASNFDHRLLKILEHLDLAKFFEHIEIPALHGRAKPDRAVFVALGEAMRRPVESLVYVGDDNETTLTAISGHGLRVVDVRRIDCERQLVDCVLNRSDSISAATLDVSGSGSASRRSDQSKGL